MAYVIKIVFTKPTAELWFSESGNSSTTLANITAWDEAFLGYLDGIGHFVASDIFESFLVFDTQVNGSAWLTAKVTQPDWMVRDAYFSAHSIATVITTYP